MENKKQKTLLMLGILTLATLSSCNRQKDDGEAVRENLGDMLNMGKDYQILLPDASNDTMEFAANEIQKYYKEATGVNLPIVKESAKTNGYVISIGNTSSYDKARASHDSKKTDEKKINLTKEALNTDGFVIFTDDKNVYINAYNDRGLMYGSFEFLEDTLGVRFLTDYDTYVPNKNEVTLFSYDKTYVPQFPQRAYLNTAVFSNKKEYVAHMRFNTDYCVMPENMGGNTNWHPFGNPAHTIPIILNFNDYMGSDNQIKAKYRDAFAHSGTGDGMVTTMASDGTVLDIDYTSGVKDDGTTDYEEHTAVYLVTEALKKLIAEDTTSEWFMVGQADRPYGCPCERCQDARNKYNASGVLIRFVNAVNGKIQDWLKETNNNRTINICTFAYDYTEEAPLSSEGEILDPSVVPDDNVYIKYAPIHGAYYYAINDERQSDNTKGVYEKWAKVTNHLMTWDYSCYFKNSFWYYPCYQSYAQTMELFRETNNEYVFMQGPYYESNLYQQNLEAYIFSKLCWSPELDVEATRNEFLKYYFGEAAYEDILDFHRISESNYAMIAAEGAAMDTDSGNFYSHEYWPLQMMNNLVQKFDDAISKTENNSSVSLDQKDLLISNLERAKLTPAWMRLYNSSRYGMDEENIYKLAQDWVDLATKYGVSKTGENSALTLDAVKVQYGLN